jgi:hypothetical protein
MDGFREMLDLAERVWNGEEEMTYKQAQILYIGLLRAFYCEIEEPIKQVAKNKIDIETMKVRVAMGIGLTALAAILAVVKAFD